MKGLTKRQKEILDWIEGFADEHGLPPTVREIGGAFGIGPAGVFDHLQALEAKGMLRRGELGSRSLELKNRRRGECTLPIIGRIAAGMPILAEEHLEGEHVVDRRMVGSRPRDHFMLRVRGDSMIEKGILDGDLVVVHKQETAENGDIVAALVDDEDATLKVYYRERGRIRLQPANSKMKPIYARNVAIQGIVKGVVRDLN